MLLAKINNASLAFGVHPLLDRSDFQINSRERICIIGRNGTGKTSLLNVMAGQLALDSGELWFQSGLRVAYLTQEISDFADANVYAVVASGLSGQGELLAEYHRVSHQLTDAHVQQSDQSHTGLLKQLADLQHRLEACDGWSQDQKITAVCTRLDVPVDMLFSSLSGGTQRRVLLARALVADPDLLLLDEPTNHLDIERIQWLEEYLKEFPGALVFVTHDRQFLQNLATRIVELDRGVLTSFPGDYLHYLAAKQKALQDEQVKNALFDKKLAEEERWIRQGIKARRTRNEGRVRSLEALRRERSQRREQIGNLKLELENSQQSGKLVSVLEDVSFSYPDGTPVVRGFSTQVMRGDRIGIIGPNGCGKSTLIKLFLNQLTPQSGRVTSGTNLLTLYFDQQREQLDPDKTVIENLNLSSDSVTLNGKQRHVISYLQDFLFAPQRAQSPVRALSGGEQNRLLLARLFTRPANLMILDEPTNDLDVESLELLEELISNFEGTVIMVSHDRAFLDNLVSSVWVFEGEGRIEEYVGGYSDWQRQRRATINTPTVSPKPVSDASGMAKSAGTTKLSYREKRELEELPQHIERLEAEQQQLEQRMAQPEFYQQAQQDIKVQLQRISEIRDDLASAYRRWELLDQRT